MDAIDKTYDIEFNGAQRDLGSGIVITYHNGEEMDEITFTTFSFLAGLLKGLEIGNFKPESGEDEGATMRNFKRLLMELHGNG